MNGDIYYVAKVSWPTDFVNQLLVGQILLIGSPAPDLVAKAIESGITIKHFEPTRISNIPFGTTLFKKHGVWKLAISDVGNSRKDLIENGRQDYLPDDDLLIALTERFENYWSEGIQISHSAKYNIGDSVQIDAEKILGKIERIQIIQGKALYSILTNRGITQVLEEDFTPLASVPGDPRTWINQPIGNAADIALTITATKMRDPLTDVIYSFQTSRTLFRPYQFKPVLKMLMGNSQRLLIADEVGLGKTIEAGLIWSELEFRTSVESVLIVCPANLRRKWKNEMYNRFDKKLVDLNSEQLNDWLNLVEKGRSEPIQAIATMEGLRSSPHLPRLDKLSPRFDLVIIDEAHYLRNEFTRTHSLGRLLSDLADSMILLSATPLNLGNTDLFNLLNLLDEAQFFDKAIFDKQLQPNIYLNSVARKLLDPDRDNTSLIKDLDKIAQTQLGKSVINRSDFASLKALLEQPNLSVSDINQAKRYIAELNTLSTIFTRTKKKETPEKGAIRHPINIDVEWTNEEYAAYTGIKNHFYDRALAQGIVPQFSTQNLLRQAASCLPAMFDLMREKYNFDDEEFEIEISEDTAADKVDEETARVIDDLIRYFGKIPELVVDSKYERFESELNAARAQGIGKQIIVFSFFRRTIQYLEKRLNQAGMSVRTMHGGIPIENRNKLMQEFRDGKFEILICSEVGSEGLDFEFCDALVNYDLPWNPMRVEQRIGRIDRFGQQAEKIHIFNMRIPGTIEDDIFMRLYLRIGVFEDSIGELEPILREDLREITAKILSPHLSPEERDLEIQRYAVAVEAKRTQLDDLANHQNLIGGVDAFLIEGFDEHTPGRGRFLGKNEVLNAVRTYLVKHGGTVIEREEDTFELIGSESISAALRSLAASNKKFNSSTLSPTLLSRDLDGHSPGLLVTFDAEMAAKRGLELMSIKHPLLDCVISDLNSTDILLNRFGAVAIDSLPNGSKYIVGIHLARYHGERNRLELWTTAIDIASGKIDNAIGDLLLQAFAANTFREGYSFKDIDFSILSEKIESLVAHRQISESNSFVSDNAAIASERMNAAKLSLNLKIESAKRTLEKVQRENRDIRVITMNKARVERLEKRLNELSAKNTNLHASLTVDAVAYVLVSG